MSVCIIKLRKCVFSSNNKIKSVENSTQNGYWQEEGNCKYRNNIDRHIQTIKSIVKENMHIKKNQMRSCLYILLFVYLLLTMIYKWVT